MNESSDARKEPPTRWHVHVDDDFIHAASRDEARAEFIRALIEDSRLLFVTYAKAAER